MRFSIRTLSMLALFLFLVVVPSWGMSYYIAIAYDTSTDTYSLYNDVSTEDNSSGCNNHYNYTTKAFIYDTNAAAQTEVDTSGFDSNVQVSIPTDTSTSDSYNAWGSLVFYCGCGGGWRNVNFQNRIWSMIQTYLTTTSWSDYVYLNERCIPQATACSNGTPSVKDPSIVCYCFGCTIPYCPNYGQAIYRHLKITPISYQGSPWEIIWCVGATAEMEPGPCT